MKTPLLLCCHYDQYDQFLSRYNHLKNVKIEDKETKDLLPIHLILGVSDYVKIKTRTAAKIGNMGEPITELATPG